MNGYKKRKTGLEGYDLNQKVHWKALTIPCSQTTVPKAPFTTVILGGRCPKSASKIIGTWI